MPDRLLGRGKFGEVYVGDWMGTPVAVKRVYDFDVKENIDLFQAEIKVWSVR
jgi:predicted Ser/Thr protein kinase